jgi:hypothetical protein
MSELFAKHAGQLIEVLHMNKIPTTKLEYTDSLRLWLNNGPVVVSLTGAGDLRVEIPGSVGSLIIEPIMKDILIVRRAPSR